MFGLSWIESPKNPCSADPVRLATKPSTRTLPRVVSSGQSSRPLALRVGKADGDNADQRLSGVGRHK